MGKRAGWLLRHCTPLPTLPIALRPGKDAAPLAPRVRSEALLHRGCVNPLATEHADGEQAPEVAHHHHGAVAAGAAAVKRLDPRPATGVVKGKALRGRGRGDRSSEGW